MVVTEGTEQSNGTTWRRNFFYERWQEIPRPLHAKVRSTIYRCRASLNSIEITSAVGNIVKERFVKVSIIGQFFLLQ